MIQRSVMFLTVLPLTLVIVFLVCVLISIGRRGEDNAEWEDDAEEEDGTEEENDAKEEDDED